PLPISLENSSSARRCFLSAAARTPRVAVLCRIGCVAVRGGRYPVPPGRQRCGVLRMVGTDHHDDLPRAVLRVLRAAALPALEMGAPSFRSGRRAGAGAHADGGPDVPAAL